MGERRTANISPGMGESKQNPIIWRGTEVAFYGNRWATVFCWQEHQRQGGRQFGEGATVLGIERPIAPSIFTILGFIKKSIE